VNNRNIKFRTQLLTAVYSLVFLFAYLVVLPSCSAEDKNNTVDKKTSSSPESHQVVLDYYRTQSSITDPGTESHLYDNLPTKVEDMVKILQGLIIHIGNLEDYRIKTSKEQDKGYEILRCEDLLKRIGQLDGRPFAVKRDIKHRLVVICREYSMLMCSMLRHKKIPARVRAGYATYLAKGKYVQHFICEYWNSEKKRWIQIEPDYVQKNKFSIGFDPLDMPKGKFITAGEGWKLCHSGKTDLQLFGLGDEGMGWNMLQPNLFTDLMALNKLEMHPWDKSPLGEKGYDKLTDEELSLVGRIADYTISVDKHFKKMRDLYNSNPALRKLVDEKP
jgi:hypothetical protein